MSKAALASAVMAVAAGAAAPGHASPSRSGCDRTVSLKSTRVAYAAFVHGHATAYRAPGRGAFARFGPRNANGYPTLFSARAAIKNSRCTTTWYRVQLPLRPNGVSGYVRAGAVSLARVHSRIVVDLSQRRLTLFRRSRTVLSARVGIGAPATPTPWGSYYVNQRLVPRYKSGPWGPAALGVSAFSPTLHEWTQGGPVAIHGTNDPSSVGRAVSHGCIRVKNGLMSKLFRATPAGTPVLIHP